MTATGESVNNPPDGHLNGHAGARAKEAAAIVIPETEDAPAQRLSREEKKAIIDELANMTALEFALVRKARAKQLGVSQTGLDRAVSERRKELKAKTKAEAPGALESDEPGIRLRTGDRPRVTDETFAVIRQDGSLYRRGGTIVCLDGDSTIEANEAFLADFLERRTSFYRMKPDANGNFARGAADAPDWLCKRITKLPGEHGIPELKGIITAPTLRLDGSLIGSAGFDAGTGLLLLPGDYPAIPEKPSHSELKAAWQTLWRPYAEFPYVSTVDVGVTVAALLTALVRRVLPTAPAFSFDAPCPSSGKTLLATCVAMLCGGEPSIIGEAKEEDEIRKRILSILAGSIAAMLFDNIKGQFVSSALEAFLTAPHYSDRLLATSKIAGFPTNVLVLFSGNNFIPAGDLWRRVLTARIDPQTENAHQRTFKLDPLAYCRHHRQELVAAGLTLLRGFIAAGRPRATKDKLGSYEVWDDLVRQCVIWLGDQNIATVKLGQQASAPISDPAQAIAKARELDPERQKHAAFLQLAHQLMGDGRWRTATLIKDASTLDGADLHATLVEIAGTGASSSINPRILGRWIEKHCDNICGGSKLVRAGIKNGNTLWKIEQTN